MNQKEINELRRRLKPEKNNIMAVYGCFVNTSKEIVRISSSVSRRRRGGVMNIAAEK